MGRNLLFLFTISFFPALVGYARYAHGPVIKETRLGYCGGHYRRPYTAVGYEKYVPPPKPSRTEQVWAAAEEQWAEWTR